MRARAVLKLGTISLLAMIFALLSFDRSLNAFTLISNNGKVAYWKQGQVGYYFHSSVPSIFRDALRQSFQTWVQVPGVSLLTVDLGETATVGTGDDRQNTLVWVTSGWSGLDFAPPPNALAVTLLSFDASDGAVVDADIFFNAQNFQWDNLASANSGPVIDVRNIATHEMGHVLGFDHSSEDFFEDDLTLLDATMYYASGAGEISRRDLKQDDINAALALYGSSAPSAPIVTSAIEVSRSGADVVFAITGSNFTEQTSFILSPRSGDDRVARYRTIESPTSARITLDLYRVNGAANLIAYNHPTARGELSLTVRGSSINATSSDGGGGCALHSQGPSKFSWVTFYFVFLSTVSLLMARRRFRDRRPKLPVEEEF